MQNSYIPPTERGDRNRGYPIGAIPREARHIDRRDQPHLAVSDPTDKLLEPISLRGRRAAQAEIGVDHINPCLMHPSSQARRRSKHRGRAPC